MCDVSESSNVFSAVSAAQVSGTVCRDGRRDSPNAPRVPRAASSSRARRGKSAAQPRQAASSTPRETRRSGAHFFVRRARTGGSERFAKKKKGRHTQLSSNSFFVEGSHFSKKPLHAQVVERGVAESNEECAALETAVRLARRQRDEASRATREAAVDLADLERAVRCDAAQHAARTERLEAASLSLSLALLMRLWFHTALSKSEKRSQKTARVRWRWKRS